MINMIVDILLIMMLVTGYWLLVFIFLNQVP